MTKRNELVYFINLEGGGELLLRKTETSDNQGNPLELWGTKTDQIVFNSEGTLAFVAGRAGKVYVVDTTTLDIVHTIHLANSTTNITSLAADRNWLYVTEGTYTGGVEGRLLRVSISGADEGFLSEQQVLSLPGVSAPNGFRDMAMSNKRYLALTAPTQPIVFMTNSNSQGNVYVVDLALVKADGTVPSSAVRTMPLPTGDHIMGRGPNYITPGSDAGEFLLSNAFDYNRGATALKWDVDETTGTLGSAPTTHTPLLSPTTSDPWWFIRKPAKHPACPGRRDHGL